MASLPACLSSTPEVLVFHRRGTWVGRRRGAARNAVRPRMLDMAGAGGASLGWSGEGVWVEVVVVVVVCDVEACSRRGWFDGAVGQERTAKSEPPRPQAQDCPRPYVIRHSHHPPLAASGSLWASQGPSEQKAEALCRNG